MEKSTRVIGTAIPKSGKAKKKPNISKLKIKLWEECKRIVRAKYQREDGMWNCFTCDRLIDEPAKAQTGHFLPSSTCGAYLRYDFRNLRVQCYNCNINQGGAGADFYRRLVETEGQEYVDRIFQDKHVSIKADAWWYMQKIEEYRSL